MTIPPADWRAATLEDRQHLFAAMQAAWTLRGWDWRRLYAEAAGRAPPGGTDYLSNLRAGRFAVSICGSIHAWLAHNEPDICAELDAALRAAYSGKASAWFDLIEAEGRYEGVDILKLPPGPLGIVTTARAEPIHGEPLRFGERFCFRVQPPLDGMAAAFQSIASSWYPLQLEAGRNLAGIGDGVTLLPRSGTPDTPEPLHEASDAGLHRFVFAIAADRTLFGEIETLPPAVPLSLSVLDALAVRLYATDRSKRAILRVNLMVRS